MRESYKQSATKQKKAKCDSHNVNKKEQLRKYKKKERKLCVITLIMNRENIYKWRTTKEEKKSVITLMLMKKTFEKKREKRGKAIRDNLNNEKRNKEKQLKHG